MGFTPTQSTWGSSGERRNGLSTFRGHYWACLKFEFRSQFYKIWGTEKSISLISNHLTWSKIRQRILYALPNPLGSKFLKDLSFLKFLFFEILTHAIFTLILCRYLFNPILCLNFTSSWKLIFSPFLSSPADLSTGLTPWNFHPA